MTPPNAYCCAKKFTLGMSGMSYKREISSVMRVTFYLMKIFTNRPESVVLVLFGEAIAVLEVGGAWMPKSQAGGTLYTAVEIAVSAATRKVLVPFPAWSTGCIGRRSSRSRAQKRLHLAAQVHRLLGSLQPLCVQSIL